MDDPDVTLRKILGHEERLGCLDSAVSGGLEAFVGRWQAKVLGTAGHDAAEAHQVALLFAGYAQLSAAERHSRVSVALRRLSAVGTKAGGLQRARADAVDSRAAGEGTRETALRAPAQRPARSTPTASEAAPPGPVRLSGGSPTAAAPARTPTPPARPKPPLDVVPKLGATPARQRAEASAQARTPGPRISAAARASASPTGPTASGLDGPVTRLRGISVGYARLLERLGVTTVRDLMYHFPRRHVDYRNMKPIKDLSVGETETVLATIWEVHARRARSGLVVIEMVAGDDSGMVGAVWFNQPHLAKSLPQNRQIVLSGRVELGSQGQPYFKSPDWELLGDDDLVHTGRLVPVYPLTEGIGGRWLRRLIKSTIDRRIDELVDYLPPSVRRDGKLLDLGTAVSELHFPTDEQWKARAERRLGFDELFLIQIGMLQRRHEWSESQPGHAFLVDRALVDAFLDTLPFRLTEGQQRSATEILGDMAMARPMTRLLQGDVGSGKTVVAALAMVVAADNGFQSVLMAPTEILAEQHYRTMSALLERFGPHYRRQAAVGPRDGLSVRLLTGSLRKRDKELIWAEAAAGELDIVVGTHAVIQDGMAPARLGLAVVDEQHRFGVEQRAALRQKGYNPDLLVMTATPIPRTLALTLYGDLDISTIRELPPGRQAIKTVVLGPQQRPSAYEFLRRHVAKGEQAFVICPLVEESEKIEAKAATAEYERLQREVFPDLRLGLLHGRMAARDKEAAMSAFRAGELQVLVSTAVVEVGIDVPNATIMLVEGADRFGLAQLHQFRGRVGRGTAESYCILLSDSPSAEAEERLQVLARTRDGCLLAEEDLRLRGPGELFGTRQSGVPDLKVARLTDIALLEEARDAAKRLLDRDPQLALPEHRSLAARVATFWRGSGDVS